MSLATFGAVRPRPTIRLATVDIKRIRQFYNTVIGSFRLYEDVTLRATRVRVQEQAFPGIPVSNILRWPLWSGTRDSPYKRYFEPPANRCVGSQISSYECDPTIHLIEKSHFEWIGTYR